MKRARDPEDEAAEPAGKQARVDGSTRRGRKYTVSIALPGSVVDNAQTPELQTYLVGQIARTAAVFCVDEIVVFDDQIRRSRHVVEGADGFHDKAAATGDADEGQQTQSWDPNAFMARLLQYIETPQYLRKALFPMHKDLRLAGLLNPLDAPHHMRRDEWCRFREGVVMHGGAADEAKRVGSGSAVNCGLAKPVLVDTEIPDGVRVTVELDEEGKVILDALEAVRSQRSGRHKRQLANNQVRKSKQKLRGRAVPPSAPREQEGLYWGYSVRLAPSLAHVFVDAPFDGGYDLTVGTSERGTSSVDDPGFDLPTFRHALIVFGGVQGIEEALVEDEALRFSHGDASSLFDLYVNICPDQGSRTIRTEEAIPITLTALRHCIRSRGAE